MKSNFKLRILVTAALLLPLGALFAQTLEEREAFALSQRHLSTEIFFSNKTCQLVAYRDDGSQPEVMVLPQFSRFLKLQLRNQPLDFQTHGVNQDIYKSFFRGDYWARFYFYMEPASDPLESDSAKVAVAVESWFHGISKEPLGLPTLIQPEKEVELSSETLQFRIDWNQVASEGPRGLPKNLVLPVIDYELICFVNSNRR